MASVDVFDDESSRRAQKRNGHPNSDVMVGVKCEAARESPSDESSEVRTHMNGSCCTYE